MVQSTDVQTLLGTQVNPKLGFNPHGAGSVGDGSRRKTMRCLEEHRSVCIGLRIFKNSGFPFLFPNNSIIGLIFGNGNTSSIYLMSFQEIVPVYTKILSVGAGVVSPAQPRIMHRCFSLCFCMNE